MFAYLVKVHKYSTNMSITLFGFRLAIVVCPHLSESIQSSAKIEILPTYSDERGCIRVHAHTFV